MHLCSSCFRWGLIPSRCQLTVAQTVQHDSTITPYCLLHFSTIYDLRPLLTYLCDLVLSAFGVNANTLNAIMKPFQAAATSNSDTISSYASTLIASKQFEVVVIFLSLATILPIVLAFHQQYLAFLSLGPGGTPSTFLGFLEIQILGLFTVADPYTVDFKLIKPRSATGYLRCLTKREGPPPEIRGIAPQRQITQKASKCMILKIGARIESMARGSDTIFVGTSCLEKHGVGLFSKTPAYPAKHRCKGEISHLHGTEGSMHMVLHPADAQAVFDAGWGQKHPLARGGYFERFVPVGFTMTYTPRNDQEIETVLRLVRAAAWFVEGESGPTEGHEEVENATKP